MDIEVPRVQQQNVPMPTTIITMAFARTPYTTRGCVTSCSVAMCDDCIDQAYQWLGSDLPRVPCSRCLPSSWPGPGQLLTCKDI